MEIAGYWTRHPLPSRLHPPGRLISDNERVHMLTGGDGAGCCPQQTCQERLGCRVCRLYPGGAPGDMSSHDSTGTACNRICGRDAHAFSSNSRSKGSPTACELQLGTAPLGTRRCTQTWFLSVAKPGVHFRDECCLFSSDPDWSTVIPGYVGSLYSNLNAQ